MPEIKTKCVNAAKRHIRHADSEEVKNLLLNDNWVRGLEEDEIEFLKTATPAQIKEMAIGQLDEGHDYAYVEYALEQIEIPVEYEDEDE